MHRIAIVNQKGGCGKTTTAINLAGVLARRGLRTLLVDMDPQGHCAAGLAIPEQRIDLTIGDAMLAPDPSQIDPSRLLWRVSRNLDLAPATMRLAGLEAPRSEFATRPEPEKALARVLMRFDALYDVCLIDCSPAIGLLTFNALSAATDVLIPVETGFFSLQGASKQINTIKSLAKRLSGVFGAATSGGPNHHILPTMHDERSILSSDLLEELKRRFAGRVAPVVIRFDQSLKEAASFGQPVVEYSPDSVGAADYGALADWLINDCLRAPRQQAEAFTPLPPIAPIAPPAPSIHVVSGIASRIAVPAGLDPRPSAPSAPSAPSFPTPTATEPADPLAGATRAAEMVALARRLQQRSVSVAEAPQSVAATSAPQAPNQRTALTQAPAPAPLAAPDKGSYLFGARATPAGVLFVQPVTMGAVAVAGEFNNWSPDAHPLLLNREAGVLEALVPLPAGVAQYRLVVDGQWIPDPHNPLRVPNPYGGTNSLIAIPDFSRLSPAPTAAPSHSPAPSTMSASPASQFAGLNA